MEQDPELSAPKDSEQPVVNELITRSVMDPELETALDDTQKETVLKEADRLPLHWLRAVAKRTTQASLNALVHSTQKLIVYLLNQLYNNHSESPSGIRYLLEKRLKRFLRFLEKNGKKHFDFDSPMPRIYWDSIQKAIRSAIFPGEGYCLRDTEAELVAILHEECRESIGSDIKKIRIPSFRRGYYWARLMENFRQRLPVNDATLQTVYTLISCNFNSPAFVEYVLASYGKDLEPGTNATDFWLTHLLYINGVVEMPEMSLNPSMDTCRKLLFERVHNEIRIQAYAQKTQRLNASIVTLPIALNGAELALWQKLKMEANMVKIKNKRDYFRKVAQVYGTTDGDLNENYLYEKYYKVDPVTKKRIMAYLTDMRRILSELSD